MAKSETVIEKKIMKISDLKANENNPRYIRDKEFEKLLNSMREFPEMIHLRPIIVDENMIVLGGNMRLKAMTELGIKETPVIVAQNLTEQQKKEFIIKDNVSFGQWDWDILVNEWEMDKLNDWGLDIPVFETLTETEIPESEKRTLDEKLDVYINSSIRNITLFFTGDKYEDVLNKLKMVMKNEELTDHSQVVEFLLNKYADK